MMGPSKIITTRRSGLQFVVTSIGEVEEIMMVRFQDHVGLQACKPSSLSRLYLLTWYLLSTAF